MTEPEKIVLKAELTTEKGGELHCIVCCSTNQNDFEPPESSSQKISRRSSGSTECIKRRDIFLDFCSSILSLKNLKVEGDLTLCSKCTFHFCTAIDANLTVESMECRVRSLQRSIIGMMKELQKNLSVLETQLAQIKDSVSRSEENFNGLNRSSSSGQQLNDVLRNRIKSVTSDLKSFQPGLAARLSPSNHETDQYFKDAAAIIKEETFEMETEETFQNFEEDDASNDDKWIGHCLSTNLPSSSNEGDDDEDWQAPSKPSSLKRSKPQKKSNPKKRKGDSTEEIMNSIFEEVSTTASANHSEAGIALSNTRTKRKSSLRSISKIKKILIESGPEDNGSDSTFSGVSDDEEFCPYSEDYEVVVEEAEKEDRQFPLPRNHHAPKKFNVLPDPYKKVDLSDKSLTHFKKYAIRSVLQQNIRVPVEEDLPAAEISPNSAEFYLRKLDKEFREMFFDYNPEGNNGSGLIHFQGIEIKINEEDKTADCSLCPYKFKLNWPQKRGQDVHKGCKGKIKKHFLRRHFNNYQCQICVSAHPLQPPKQYSMMMYKLHLQEHNDVHPNICPICEKPLNDYGSLILRRHLWTHKSQQEREEAEQSGEVNPNKVPGGQQYQCHCGKSFPAPSKLLKHQEVHMKLDRKEMTYCDRCGTNVKKSYLAVHQQKYCSIDKSERKTCPYCQASLKKTSLSGHIQRMHSKTASEKPFLCDVCSKTFRAKNDLFAHRQIHSADKISCEFCGKAFNTKKKIRRHHQKCTGKITGEPGNSLTSFP